MTAKGRKEKASLSGSTRRTTQGYRDPQFAVSAHSRWYEMFWRFDALSAGTRSPSITWDFALIDGGRSTDPKHRLLLESFKEMLWAMLTLESTWGAVLSVASCGRVSVGIRELFRWMVFHGHTSFKALEASVQDRYIDDLPYLLTNRSSFYQVMDRKENEDYFDDLMLPSLEDQYEAPSSNCGSSSSTTSEAGFEQGEADEQDSAYTYNQASLRVNTIYYIHAQQAALKECGVPVFDGAAFGGAPSHKITSTLAVYVVNRLPPLPDEVALPIISTAMNWVEERAEDILALQHIYLGCRELEKLSNDKRSARRHTLKTVSAFEFSLSPDTGLAWRAPLVGETLISPEYGEVFLRPFQQLRVLLFRARDAAMLVLSFLTGMRTGELCSIRVAKSENGLPSCIKVRPSKDGMLELFFVTAVLSKGVRVPREEQWLVGCRPSGAKEVPLAVKAIQTAERLWTHWREWSGSDRLFLTFSQPKSLPQSPSNVVPILTDTANHGMRFFVHHEVDLSQLEDTNLRNEELWKFRDSKGLNVRNLHWRKTFAAYILEVRSSLLPSVQLHFKHLTSAMTESAYFPPVFRLRQEAESARMAETINWFSQEIDGVTLLGSMAKLVDEWFDADGLRGLSRADKEKAISKVVYSMRPVIPS